jgi:hypothetical protein
MALDVEGVVHGGMDREEFLRRAGALEALHLALPPSRRLMRILDAIVFPSPALMAALDPQIADRCAVSPQVVRDQSLGDEGVFLEKLAHQFQRGMLVSLGLDQHVEDLAFGVDRAPEIEHSAVDFSDRPRQDARSCEAWAGAFASPLR